MNYNLLLNWSFFGVKRVFIAPYERVGVINTIVDAVSIYDLVLRIYTKYRIYTEECVIYSHTHKSIKNSVFITFLV